VTEPHPLTGESAPHALPSRLLHDLRTPLNQIIGFSELLIEQAQEQDRADFVSDLQRTHAAGKQLLSLVEQNFHAIPVPDARVAATPRREHLPIVLEGTSVDEPSAPDADVSTPHGLVLVVDDGESNRDLLSRLLQRQGYTVTAAEGGQQAIEELQATAFDLVLLDVMMPEMDGYEVLQRLKADAVWRHIPVIMISALSELDSVVRCIAMGAEDYLPKPFDSTLLKARIGACLEKKRAHDREALLFEQLQESHERMEQLAVALQTQNGELARWRRAQDADLEIARTSQQALVNIPLPVIAGWRVESIYRPVIQVGGDVYGWRELDHGVWVFWLADATGHGVAAALFTNLVAFLFNDASAASKTAHGILRHVNAGFCSVLRGRAFLSACCAVIEADGRLTFAGAGHPPLIIRRGDGSTESLPSLNTMIGIDAAMQIDETVVTLQNDDLALLYTDGLHSLKSPAGQRLTSESVADATTHLNAGEDLLPRLVAELGKRSDTQPFDDDLAAIALHRG